MADVLLRESLEQMRTHLRLSRFSDAFALGQHILHFYPKHIETYTVMAQLSLATNDLAGAYDLLRRVLSADPENVVGLAGMALISEAQGKQDDALWYLERAYEVQPSNDELRNELLRVRELYYGAAPTRVELTSGALARVYARQGQYAQAINEFRRLLRNDSKRFDARVGLAETLYRAGRTDEAAQVAQAVMSDAPYALKPNLILGALWTENAVPEGQQFLQRAHQLDPEHRVARDLLGERFDGMQQPRIPVLGEGEAAGSAPVIEIEPPEHSDIDPATIRAAAALLSEIERGQEPEHRIDQQLFGDLDAMNRTAVEPVRQAPVVPEVVEIPAPPMDLAVASPVIEAPSEPVGAPVVETPDTTLQEILEAERQKVSPPPVAPPPTPPAEKAPTSFAERLRRSKGDGVSSDAIASAAAALATSIALDKTNQPSPTRRAHPSIPKVRPVIRAAQEKLPVWLRLSATPANAPASFDAPPASTADRIEPISTHAQDRPAWLVEAQAASEQQTITPRADLALPDWLKPSQDTPPARAVTPTPQEPAMPSWLRDETAVAKSSVAEPAPIEPKSSVTAIPDWLRDDTASPQRPAPIQDETPVVTEGWTNTPAEKASDKPAWQSVLDQTPPGMRAEPAPETRVEPRASEPLTTNEKIESEPPPVADRLGPPTPTQSLPDSGTMLMRAREKRASGDFKGALELYERVMHRRPNYLDQVTGDLQEMIQGSNVPTSAHRLLGEAYAMAGRFKESLEQYRMAMGK